MKVKKIIRIILVVLLSPLCLVALLYLVLYLVICVSEYYHEHKYDNPRTLTQITGVKFPKYDVLKFETGKTICHFKLNDCVSAEFRNRNTAEFYSIIDSLSRVDGSGWSIIGDWGYEYSREEPKLNLTVTHDQRLLIYYGGDVLSSQ